MLANEEINIQKLRDLYPGPSFAEAEAIFIPFCVGSNHFLCLWLDIATNIATFYSSIRSTYFAKNRKQIKQFLNMFAKLYQLHQFFLRQGICHEPHDGASCGNVVIEVFRRLVNKDSRSLTNMDCPLLRLEYYKLWLAEHDNRWTFEGYKQWYRNEMQIRKKKEDEAAAKMAENKANGILTGEKNAPIHLEDGIPSKGENKPIHLDNKAHTSPKDSYSIGPYMPRKLNLSFFRVVSYPQGTMIPGHMGIPVVPPELISATYKNSKKTMTPKTFCQKPVKSTFAKVASILGWFWLDKTWSFEDALDGKFEPTEPSDVHYLPYRLFSEMKRLQTTARNIARVGSLIDFDSRPNTRPPTAWLRNYGACRKTALEFLHQLRRISTEEFLYSTFVSNYEISHRCNNGKLGCINPYHLVLESRLLSIGRTRECFGGNSYYGSMDLKCKNVMTLNKKTV